MGRAAHGASCLWGELSKGAQPMERAVHGASCTLERVVMGRVVMGRVSMGRIVRQSTFGVQTLWFWYGRIVHFWGPMSQNLNNLGRIVTVSERTIWTAILSTWRWTNDQGHQPINNSHGIGHGFTVKYDSLLN
jgi:hypothetical protein